jgi:hypothetical protein
MCSWRWIVSYVAIIMAALALVTPCTGQDTAKVDPAMTAAMIGRVLAKARTSGSLVYHGQCQDRGSTWDIPTVSRPEHNDVTPVRMLQDMFADDSEMHVTQDANGNIRMAEANVSRDLLDLRIVQVPFSSDSGIHDPSWAVSQIMVTPDVKNYMTVNNIGPMVPDFRFFGGPLSPSAPKISDDLYYVTVSEALDYILKTYPGFWAYEECEGEAGSRKVFFQFFPTVSEEIVRLP